MIFYNWKKMQNDRDDYCRGLEILMTDFFLPSRALVSYSSFIFFLLYFIIVYFIYLAPLLYFRAKGDFYLNTSSFWPYGIEDPDCPAAAFTLVQFLGELFHQKLGKLFYYLISTGQKKKCCLLYFFRERNFCTIKIRKYIYIYIYIHFIICDCLCRSFLD